MNGAGAPLFHQTLVDTALKLSSLIFRFEPVHLDSGSWLIQCSSARMNVDLYSCSAARFFFMLSALSATMGLIAGMRLIYIALVLVFSFGIAVFLNAIRIGFSAVYLNFTDNARLIPFETFHLLCGIMLFWTCLAAVFFVMLHYIRKKGKSNV